MKKIIIGVIIVLVVAGGAVAYILLNNDKTANNQKTASVSNEKNISTTEQASIEDLLTRNASLKCSYNVNDTGSVNTGTAYFAGGKNMYGEFTNTVNGKSITAYVIRNGDTQYVWMKDSNTGFKTDVSASNKESQQQMSQQLDPDKKYQFDCVNWKKDESRFTPPTSVTFTDIAAQTKNLQEKINDASQQ